MHPAHPITDDQIDELDAFLNSDATPDDCMDIAMLDGFFTALLIGPGTPPPGQWLPVIWGGTEDEPMAWDSDEQREHFTLLVMAFYSDRLLSLQEGVDEFEALVYMDESEGRSAPVLDEWCMGFVRGIAMDPQAWDPLVQTLPDGDGGLLTPMFLYGTEEGWEELDSNPSLSDKHQEFADALGACVIGIRDYWLPHRKAAATYRRADVKVGRNDPCPCGSGMKYKKCCGTDLESLH